jgi:hypothetical protein
MFLLREPVSARDLVRWALFGKFPFFGAESVALSGYQSETVKTFREHFNPQSIWSPATVTKHCLQIMGPCVLSRYLFFSSFIYSLIFILFYFFSNYF